jgi:ribosomal protein S18 acetylase RimI-like enzyme
MAEIAAASGYAAWTEVRLSSELALDRTRALILEELGRAAGFAIGWQVMDEVELHLIAVDPLHRRKGFGRALLDAFSATHLEVSEHNGPALALYQSAGYTEVGTRADYYGPGDAAILMRRIRR